MVVADWELAWHVKVALTTVDAAADGRRKALLKLD
jgi:hypothetical protein